jgi:hypothetical protein
MIQLFSSWNPRQYLLFLLLVSGIFDCHIKSQNRLIIEAHCDTIQPLLWFISIGPWIFTIINNCNLHLAIHAIFLRISEDKMSNDEANERQQISIYALYFNLALTYILFLCILCHLHDIEVLVQDFDLSSALT